MVFLLLCAFLAGFVDSIVGGGGLIQLPALFVFLPPEIAANVAAVMGTNKFAAMCGTTIATVQYARHVTIPKRIVLPAAGAAILFSFLGARAVSLLDPKLIRPVILILLLAVAIYTIAKKKGAPAARSRIPHHWQVAVALGLGCVIGFYDGFFGPGTGSFLIISFVALFGFDFLLASASAKFVNLSTNISAIVWFATTHNILFKYGLPLAAANVAGATLGSHLALKKGSQFVRRIFIVVVAALIARFAWELAHG